MYWHYNSVVYSQLSVDSLVLQKKSFWIFISIGESNTGVSTYTTYKHLQQFYFHPLICKETFHLEDGSQTMDTDIGDLFCKFWLLFVYLSMDECTTILRDCTWYRHLEYD